MNIININWKAIGAYLMTLSNEEQAEFFEGMVYEMLSGTFKSSFERELQLCSIKDTLKPNTKEFLKKYLPCLWEED